MLKKTVSYTMIFLLLISVIGVTVNRHYSGNKLFSFSIYSEAESCCDHPCDCCTNTSDTFNLKDSFFKSDFKFDLENKIINSLLFFVTEEINPAIKTVNEFVSYRFKFIKYYPPRTTALLQCFRL